MAFLSWFQKKPADEDYEQVLASLALSVQKRQTKLSEIRLRERRATLLVTVWTFAAWAAYTGVWWTGVLGRKNGAVNGLWGVPVILGPVLILFTRRLVQLWYAQKGNAEEKTLKALLVQQRNKIEEIKKKTNYYTTKNLLERYGDAPVQRTNAVESPSGQRRGPPSAIQSRGLTPMRDQVQSPQTPVRQGQPVSPTLPPLPTPQRQWYDKLADALLGDDTASTGTPPASRYALICERCFTHNGLVKEEQWEDAQYVCPKCGHFNASSRSRKAGASPATSPVSPRSSLAAQGLSENLRPERPSSSSLRGSQSAPAPRETSSNTPLSESTVFVERHDVEPEDVRQDGVAHVPDGGGKPSTDTTTQMEVDT